MIAWCTKYRFRWEHWKVIVFHELMRSSELHITYFHHARRTTDFWVFAVWEQCAHVCDTTHVLEAQVRPSFSSPRSGLVSRVPSQAGCLGAQVRPSVSRPRSGLVSWGPRQACCLKSQVSRVVSRVHGHAWFLVAQVRHGVSSSRWVLVSRYPGQC